MPHGLYLVLGFGDRSFCFPAFALFYKRIHHSPYSGSRLTAHNPPKFLIIALRRLGDVLLTTPIARSLKATWPDAHVSAMVFRGTGIILEGNPCLDEVIEIPAKLRGADWWHLIRTRGRQYDWAITTQTGDRPTLLAIVTGRQRAGFVPSDRDKAWWRRALLTRWLPEPRSDRHVVQRYLDLARLVGARPVGELVAPTARGFDARAWLNEAFAAIPTPNGSSTTSVPPLAICHPYPMVRYKEWPDAHWRTTIQRLLDDGYRVALSGGPSLTEIQRLEQLLGELRSRVVILAGRLTLAQLADVLKQASLFIGTDTSVTHLAAATGTPVTAIFGPTDPRLWGPWPQGGAPESNPWQARGPLQQAGHVRLIQDDRSCVPCQEEGCDRHESSHSDCLDHITPDQVYLPRCRIL